MRKWIIITIVLLFISAAMGLEALIQIPYFLIIGWIHYLARVLPMVHVNYGMIFTGMAAYALAVLVSHMVFRCLWHQGSRDRPWRWGWTMCICLLVPVLFGITIAAGGMVHW